MRNITNSKPSHAISNVVEFYLFIAISRSIYCGNLNRKRVRKKEGHCLIIKYAISLHLYVEQDRKERLCNRLIYVGIFGCAIHDVRAYRYTRKRKKKNERSYGGIPNTWVDVMSVQLLNTRGYFNNLMSVNSNFECKL